MVQRGVNGETTFHDRHDYQVFIKWLQHYTAKWNISVHAWVLMKNHIHLLITPKESDTTSRMMGNLSGRYANYFNRRYQRQGSLWQGRYYHCLVASNFYLLCCYRYIELNPVRASLVDNAQEYEWSSFQCNGMGQQSDFLVAHTVYKSLGMNQSERQSQYRKLVNETMNDTDLDLIRKNTNDNGVLVMPKNEDLVKDRLSLMV